MADRRQKRTELQNQEAQKALVEEGMKLPGVAAAIEVYTASARSAGSLRVVAPVVRFATGGNS